MPRKKSERMRRDTAIAITRRGKTMGVISLTALIDREGVAHVGGLGGNAIDSRSGKIEYRVEGNPFMNLAPWQLNDEYINFVLDKMKGGSRRDEKKIVSFPDFEIEEEKLLNVLVKAYNSGIREIEYLHLRKILGR